MDLLKPEYIVLKIAGYTLGYSWKHTEETIEKMKKSKINIVLTEEVKKNIGIAMKAVSVFNVTTKGIKVVVFNLETRVTEEYLSIRSVAQALGAHMETIRRCIKSNKLYLNKYSISLALKEKKMFKRLFQ